MIEKVTGFIMSTTDFKETSLILHLFTKEHGLIGVMAKGVKSLKSPLRALTLPYTYGYFYLYYKEGKLSLLKDVDLINPLQAIHEDILKISYVNYLADLTSQVYKESEEESLFGYFEATILKINEGFDPAILTNILELKYLPFLGVGLFLNRCVSCGSTKNIVTIDGDAGGLVCQNCYHNERIVSLNVIKYLRMFLYVDIKKISKIAIKEEYKKEIDTFITTYYNRYTGIYLKSKEYLKKLNVL